MTMIAYAFNFLAILPGSLKNTAIISECDEITYLSWMHEYLCCNVHKIWIKFTKNLQPILSCCPPLKELNSNQKSVGFLWRYTKSWFNFDLKSCFQVRVFHVLGYPLVTTNETGLEIALRAAERRKT